MTSPTNHTVTITLPDGKHVRCLVVYLQPIEAPLQPQRLMLHIMTTEWLAAYGHKAVYSTPVQSIPGRFTPCGYGDAAGQWLVMGTFERDDSDL